MRVQGVISTATLHRCRFFAAAVTAGVWAALLPLVAHAVNITASTAADVCLISANPCVVNQQVDVVANSTLDFGIRDVNVGASGRFNFGAGNGVIKCGSFTANPSGVNYAINARGAGPVSGTASGVVEVDARKGCSQGSRACLQDTDCQLGACGIRRCSLRSTKECNGDSDCNWGTCLVNTTRRCSLNSTIRCTSDAQCNLGTCPSQLTCQGDAASPVSCSSNTDCQFGACSIGTGAIDINGSILGNSDVPAIVSLHAASTVAIRKSVNLNSTSSNSDGGELEMTTASGDIEVFSPTGSVSVGGGGLASGGALRVVAGGSFRLNGAVDCTGGDFDGGSVDIAADVDVTVNGDINCNAISGAGYGGEILIDAGRDLSVNGVGANNRTDLFTEGHTDAFNSSGDGGSQELTAGRDLAMNVFTTYQGSGSAPEGYGSDMFISAGGDFVFNGQIESASKGLLGAGGFVQISSGGKASVLESGGVNLTGGEGGGGALEFIGSGAVDFRGTTDASAGSLGSGGAVLVSSDADVAFSGHLTTNGGAGGSGDGQLEINACRITVAATGFLDNKALQGLNLLKAHESMKLLASSKVINSTGTNVLTYRSAAKPPVRSGTITPTPQLVVDPTLVGCPVCGNAEIDQGETCDDGNTRSGDGCSSACQNEKCIAQTPGYPAVPLCSDGDDCSVDTCNTSVNGGQCQHLQTCDDGIACTTDSCVSSQCVHAPVDASCSDGNVCTDDLCSAQTGCSHVANVASCDDGAYCTLADHCSNKLCVGGGARNCSDGVDCTVDACNETSDQCTHQTNNAACSDGSFCDGVETCNAVTGCVAGVAVNCSNLNTACGTGVCNEAQDTCSTQPANEGGSCDDGNFCTVGDTCQSGVCVGGAARDCSDGVACTVDACNETSDQCTHQTNNAACSDGSFCDGVETCNAVTGCVAGVAVDCSNLNTACGTGVCNEAQDTCSTQPGNEGGGCNDGNVCTSGDKCSAGLCQGQAIPNCAICGNGIVDIGEDCDDGNTLFVSGQYCAANCLRVPCGKPTNSADSTPKASDALFTLRSAVGSAVCDRRLCDVDNNGFISAGDALRILRAAVGQSVTLTCPAVP